MQQFTIRLTWLPAWPSFIAAMTSLAAPGNRVVYDSTGTETSEMKSSRENEAAFLRTIDEHHWIIDKICRAYGKTRADKQDLYQEIVYQLWKFYSTFSGDSKITTWMYTVALRSAIQPFRRTRRIPIEFRDVLPDRPSPEKQPDDGIDDRVFRALHRIENYERAILMLQAEGYSNKEIGAMLEMGEGAVTSRIRRMRKELGFKI